MMMMERDKWGRGAWLAGLALFAMACSGNDGDTDTKGDSDDTDTDTEVPAEDTDLLPSDVCINEYMASNQEAYVLKDGTAPDWIELHNPTATEINLAGWTISDDPEEPGKAVLDGLSIPANGFLLVFADGDPEEGADHLPFKLSAGGEQIALFGPDGTGEVVTFGPMAEDFSFGKSPDCCDTEDCIVFSSGGTPGTTNAP